MILVVGVLLFVVNMFPSTDLFGQHHWDLSNSLLAGIGAALALLAVVTKPPGGFL